MSAIDQIHRDLTQGSPLTREQALYLYQHADLLQLGKLADARRQYLHPEGEVGFVVDRNVNYTNICSCQCRFCAFYRDMSDPEGYVLDEEEICAKVEELAECGGTQLLMQGGIHPDLPLSWFEDLFSLLRQRYPAVQIHSLSPAEVMHLAAQEGISVRACIQRLQRAGLESIPGGGAEVLVDAVRRRISPNKIGWREWAEVMETAHELGMKTTATLMFGCGESPEQLVEHLLRVRDIQDRTGGFTAFISWSYQPDNTELGHEIRHGATGTDYLRVVALSRLVLNNVPNIQASWVTQGARMAQTALRFGANDMGGTMLEENVVAAAGVSFRMSKADIIHLIRGAGFAPVQRTTKYEVLERY